MSWRTKCCTEAIAGRNHQTVRETEAEPSPLLSASRRTRERNASADYIHLYHGNAALLAESLGSHSTHFRLDSWCLGEHPPPHAEQTASRVTLNPQPKRSPLTKLLPDYS